MDSNNAKLERDVGRLEATVGELDKRTANMDAKLDRVVLHIEREKASRRTLLVTGSVLGSFVGAVVTGFLTWWHK